ncbi:envelope glycoprotein 150 [Equid gammaherpesvirus 5]|uniref:Envelope glycoprotein 150 n=1 Tax=Equid gammaherpesvirus 5 TaxID=10371 RepID=A0A0B4Q5N6_9GAMA|nr:envelope glycoprotein 150 [Equid gammaherpesvirus 5]AIU39553.1 envelope glycoprotein 150 [Equid gammaherpesvirus 5]UTK45525.1 envelope glycoprotein 150 [Equid gammaherpesvirus 5]UTK45605.1 envelope glycoprotein 150 [Equid gammaherpesvirus 5]UTK45684.1 envelope glycoprotein 150 [Equid gammaherpesvirus 5]UTK45762.1 envelope glycoprotein 150 [Equid gammaherpesvirus 5]
MTTSAITSMATTTTTTTAASPRDDTLVLIETVLFCMLFIILLIILCIAYVHIKNLYLKRKFGVTAIYSQVEAECSGVLLDAPFDNKTHSIYMPD